MNAGDADWRSGAWADDPCAFAHAQARVFRIGYLSPRKTYGELDAAFMLGMQELG